MLSPLAWRDFAQRVDGFDSGPRHLDGAIIQRWAGSAAEMHQPALDHHYLAFHEGGPKRVRRETARRSDVRDVALHSYTAIEAGSAYRWHTIGPIAFGHIYVTPERFARTIGETFDVDPTSVTWEECIGTYEPLSAQLIRALIEPDTDDPDWMLSADYYLEALLVRLYQKRQQAAEARTARMGLTPVTLKRVQSFIRERLETRITLDDLARIAGYSRYHFARAFRDCTGLPPYAFLLQERINLARDLLSGTDEPIDAIARRCGFATHAQFSTRFKQAVGVTPTRYRETFRGR